MGKRSKIFTQILTVVRWQASAANERAVKDDVRRENELLCAEVDSLQRELKKLKQVIEQLHREYESSKEFDPVRRYGIMKAMVKRTVMHFKLNPDEPGSSSQGPGGMMAQGCRDYTHQLESARRREDKYLQMSKHELSEENLHLQDQTKEMRRKCAIIRDLVDRLEKNYESSKRFNVLQRYSILKAIIKTVIHDNLV